MEIAELFNQLESNQPHTVEEIKKTFHENFNATKESWLVNGLFDYYVSTSSMRSVEILVGVREPHDKHLFDKITDTLKGPLKLQALTLLGHIVRRRPTWVYKITQHQIMKELLKLLKAESDILCLMSAVLVLIVLLPMIPALMGPYLQDVFEVFSRLASWNTNNPTKLPEEHLLHLQVSLYALFHRLYGMYPCNFISFLRNEYGMREHLGIFSHTIKPMLETVRMHPLLVTASKDAETATTRWKKMEDHDVIVECAKYAIDSMEKSREEGSFQSINTSFRSRGSIEHGVALDLSYVHHLKSSLPTSAASSFLSSHLPIDQDLWSPSIFSGLSTPPVEESAPTSIPQTPNSQNFIVSTSLPHQEGTSPPEAAIEATPETTPVKDIRHLTPRHPPVTSSAVRALTTFSSGKWQGITSGSSTPQSQPSSPMKKELSPFRFPDNTAFEQPRRDSVSSVIAQKLNNVHMDRQVISDTHMADSRPTLSLRPKTPGQPTSPLRIITQNDCSIPNSPVPVDTIIPLPGGVITKPLVEKNGFRLESSEPVPVPAQMHGEGGASQEDQEVLEIVKLGEQLRIDTQPKHVGVSNEVRQCDSVLQEVHPPHVGDYEECEQETGSPCTSGGLHMPNSRSMLDFARRVHHRQRFYSQCLPESGNEGVVGLSTGSSPGQGSNFPLQDKVRRANSCPEMKKGPGLPTAEVNISRPLDETEEFEESEGPSAHNNQNFRIPNGKTDYARNCEETCRQLLSASTQTVDWVPLPYEHLFLSVFPPILQSCDMKSSSAPSPAPMHHQTDPPLPRLSPYAMVDKYIETVVQGQEVKKPKYAGTETEIKILKEQLVLLNIQLHFERQRREVHAERNRRLLGKSRSNRALDEHNLALRDQLSLLQKDIEKLHGELDKGKKETKLKEQQMQESITYWQNQCIAEQKELLELKTRFQLLQQELKTEVTKHSSLLKEMQIAEAKLFDLGTEMKQAIAQVVVGEQLKESVEQLQKKLLLMGELQQRYRDRFSQLSLLKCPDEEVTVLQDSYISEVQSLQEMLEIRSSSLEAAKTRIAELETSLCRKDQLIAEQKRVLRSLEEEYDDRLEAVENKYIAQRALNKKMEEHMLELFHRLDLAEDSKRKEQHSPDSSGGCQEAIVGSVDSADRHTGPSSFSPHNSPLSQSLSSPGGLSVSGILGRDCVEMKNLQVIVDQPERTVRIPTNTFAGGQSQEQSSTMQSPGTEPPGKGSGQMGEEG
ncbi:hypothetical protein R5R35_003057 [Gryllus longicercus]|uniref:Hamartin n=1 Tax=Gryllus longicercus TaxID=2509291 RepID=A0AAN9VU76_9ORTH